VCNEWMCSLVDADVILEDIKYHAERITGIDIDGDGYLGRPPPAVEEEPRQVEPRLLGRMLGRVRSIRERLRGLPERRLKLA